MVKENKTEEPISEWLKKQTGSERWNEINFQAKTTHAHKHTHNNSS